MPRTRNIPWEVRLSIFLDFRKLKKVYPTAKRHGVARSTVSGIVADFKEMGFSIAPRPELSAKVLTLAQERHVIAVMESLQQPQLVDLAGPGAGLRGGLNPKEALGEQAGATVAQKDPLPLDEAVAWHLNETEAGQMVQEARQAIRIYGQRCLELWREIRRDLEDACGLMVKAYCGPDKRVPEAHIFHLLVDEIYKAGLNRTYRPENPDEHWTYWQPADDGNSILRAGGTEMAVGGPEDHQAVKLGMQLILENKSGDYVIRLSELTRLHQDLEYVKEITENALRIATSEEINRGICPACPYPEAHQVTGQDDD